jgi:hypothetical protein
VLDLVLGPVLRYADATTATVWVETSASAVVTVLGRSCPTFAFRGHHYGYVVVDGLEPGTDQPYDVHLDGVRVWPRADDERPPPRLRTLADDAPFEVVFGSCRVDRPHEAPWTLSPEEHPNGVGVDALYALSRSLQAGERHLPDLLLMLGDQVYADEGLSPVVQARQRRRRDSDSEPVGEIADFEEYTWLYQDTWSNPEIRWLLATVPSAMIFDDHDVRDDWNTSAAWRQRIQRLPWWPERIAGAYASYWLYQHLGNVSPEQVTDEGLLDRLRRDGDAALMEFVRHADDEVGGRKRSCWSYARDVGGVRLVVIDTRSGRVLESGTRAMLSEDEWAAVDADLQGGCDHLLVASTLPLLLERSLHDLERWDDAVAEGAWGQRARGLGERVRQALDLEHWAAFPASFDRLVDRLGEIAAGRRGRAPSTVVVLSGDVHHSSVSPLRFPSTTGARSAVVQVVSSPLRNAVPRRMLRAFTFSTTRAARALGRALVRSARLPDPAVDWRLESGPWFANVVGTLRLDGPEAELRLDRAVLQDGRSQLEPLHRQRLDSAPA